MLLPTTTLACSCGGNWSEERSYELHDKVAIVRITEMKLQKSKGYSMIVASGQVIEQLKGRKSSTVKLYGFPRDNTCSQELDVDEVYVVFWSGKKSSFNICNVQPALSSVSKDLIQKWRANP